MAGRVILSFHYYYLKIRPLALIQRMDIFDMINLITVYNSVFARWPIHDINVEVDIEDILVEVLRSHSVHNWNLIFTDARLIEFIQNI